MSAIGHQITSGNFTICTKLEETGTVNKGEKDAKEEEKEREETNKEANIKQVSQTQKAAQYRQG